MSNKFFIFRGIDRADSRALRDDTTAAQRDYNAGASVIRMVYGGALYSESDAPIGTCLVLEAPGLAEVENWLRESPFVQAGLFVDISIERWGWTFGR